MRLGGHDRIPPHRRAVQLYVTQIYGTLVRRRPQITESTLARCAAPSRRGRRCQCCGAIHEFEHTGIANSGTLFDIDGDGYREQTGWLTPFDGFLVFDTNNDGEINSIAEMAVSQTINDVLGNPLGISMASLDSNGNGYFDADDTRFFDARVWTDRNLNGSVDLGELWSLTRFGIDYMSLTGVAVSDGDNQYRDSAGNRIAWESAYGIIGDDPGKAGIFTTLSVGYDPMGVKTLEDAQHPEWYILQHEDGELTTFGTGAGNLILAGLAATARTVFGAEGNDFLAPSVGNVAGEAGVFVDGKEGDDTIIGGAGDDVLTGGAGSDIISGGDGDDIISADDEDSRPPVNRPTATFLGSRHSATNAPSSGMSRNMAGSLIAVTMFVRKRARQSRSAGNSRLRMRSFGSLRRSPSPRRRAGTSKFMIGATSAE